MLLTGVRSLEWKLGCLLPLRAMSQDTPCDVPEHLRRTHPTVGALQQAEKVTIRWLSHTVAPLTFLHRIKIHS
jgi:hypothetical protein